MGKFTNILLACWPALAAASEPPVFTRQPQPVAVAHGGTVRLAAAATGAGSVLWEWRKDGVVIPGAFSETLTLWDTREADTAEYHAVARDFQGGRWSQPAAVLVRPPQAAAGHLDGQFTDPGLLGTVHAIAELPDGSVLAAGALTAARDRPVAGNLVKLDPTGLPVANFRVGLGGAAGNVFALAANGAAVLVGGDFPSFDGFAAPGLVKLDAAGILDPAFAPNLPTGMVDIRCLLPLADGRCYVAGRSRNGATVTDWVVRLLANGARDTAFISPALLNGRVRAPIPCQMEPRWSCRCQ